MSRVLVVSYHFPPMLSMASVRIQRFVRSLGEHGWGADVLTARPSRYPLQDSALARGIPAGVGVFREAASAVPAGMAGDAPPTAPRRARPSLHPQGIAKRCAEKFRQWAPWASEPNAWRRQAERVGRGIVAGGGYDVIFSSSGPQASHAVAARLARLGGLPWVAEFRDALVDSPYLHAPTGWHRRYHRKREGRVVRGASAVVVTSGAHQASLRQRYGAGLCVRVITNAYDPREYPGEDTPRPSRFVLSYAGSLYGARSIVPLLRGWRAWLDRPETARWRPLLQILGESFNADLAALIREMDLADTVAYHGPRSHAEVLGELARSSAVLVVKSPHDRIHIPGKIYESIGAGRPVLLLGPDSEAAGLLQRFDLGVVVSSPEPADIAGGLEAIAARSARPVTPPAEYRLDRQTARLVAVLEEAVGRHRGALREEPERGSAPARWSNAH